MKLYELATEYEIAKQEIQEAGLDPQTLADTLDGLAWDFEQKIEKVALYRRGLAKEAELIKDEIERLQARKKSLDSESDWLKGYILTNMQNTGINKVKTPMITVSKMKGRESLKVDCDLSKLSPHFVEISYKPNKANLKKFIESGQTLEGVYLETGPDTIQVR